MTDSYEIESLFAKSNRVDESSYSKVEYLELTDEQRGSYETGQVSFNTDGQMKHHIVYSDSILALPIECSKSVDGRVAVKNSILSFIQGVQITSGNGTVITNEQLSTPIVANMNLLLDSSIDFIEGNELLYCGPDRTIDRNASGADRSVLGSASASASVGKGLVDDARNFLKNPALCDRISVLEHRSTVVPLVPGQAGGGGNPAVPQVNGLQKFMAYIPLKYIHGFFKVMDFPLPNLSLRITFNIAGVGSYTAYNPWTTPLYPAHSTAGALSAPVDFAAAANVAAGVKQTAGDPFPAYIVPSVSAAVPSPVIDSTRVLHAFTDRFEGVHAPRILLKSVYFTSDVAKAVAAKVVEGFTKELTYTVSNSYFERRTAGQGGNVQWPFVQGIIRPTRMWVFPLAAGTLQSSENTFPARTGPIMLKNTNIQLNGDNFYNNPLKTQYDFYREFKKQLIMAGSSQAAATPISFSDFTSGAAYYCFDLSRNLTVKTNNLCTMALQTELYDQNTKAAPTGAVDMYIIVERLQVMTLKVSEGGIEVLVKQGGPVDSQ